MRDVLCVCNNVKKMMYSITQVNVGSSANSIHHLCSCRSAVIISVRSTVVHSYICFCFCNNSSCDFPIHLCKQNLAKQFVCDQKNVFSCIKIPRKFHLCQTSLLSS